MNDELADFEDTLPVEWGAAMRPVNGDDAANQQQRRRGRLAAVLGVLFLLGFWSLLRHG